MTTLSTSSNFIDSYSGATVLLTDGKIINAFVEKKANNQLFANILRYLPNGSIDASWGQGGTVSTYIPGVKDVLKIYSINEQPDGKILITGTMDTIMDNYYPLAILLVI